MEVLFKSYLVSKVWNLKFFTLTFLPNAQAGNTKSAKRLELRILNTETRSIFSLKYGVLKQTFSDVKNDINIAKIANAVQWHNYLSGNNYCHEFRFSNVRIVISVSNVTSLQDCQKFSNNCQHCKKNWKNWKLKNCQNVGQFMFPHHSDQMSQRSQVSRVAL